MYLENSIKSEIEKMFRIFTYMHVQKFGMKYMETIMFINHVQTSTLWKKEIAHNYVGENASFIEATLVTIKDTSKWSLSPGN